ncbi:hypothetical protein B0H12DRAFT_1328298 [Mycena haematopus]|nr:hypothetical protein B0H12DRAFT_1328298 [Mycena haematopus]
MLLLGGGRRRAILPRALVNRRCTSSTTRTGKIVDERPGSTLDALPLDALPLDAVVSQLVSKTKTAPQFTVLWPPPKQNKDSKALAREIRARIVADDPMAALDILRNVPRPHPALVVHAAVHALLRAKQVSRAGALLLAFAVERRHTIKEPRIHFITITATIKALLEVVPTAQGRQDRARTSLRPSLLIIDAQLVSEPALRTALGLYIKARQLFVRRQKDVTMGLWHALLNQREWIPAALLFELQVRDYRLRRTLPTLLRIGNPDGRPMKSQHPRRPMNPQERWHLRRRLDLLRREDNIRPNRSLFADLCFRLAGVISSITQSTESGLLSTNFPFTDPDAKPVSPPPLRPPKAPLTPQRAWHHARVALQALTILGQLVDARQVPFGDISAWVSTVGSLPSSLRYISVYTMIDGRPKRVFAREHLRAVLERYATALPRVPHIYSEFPFGTSGFVRRGLKHKLPDDPAEAINSPTPSIRHVPSSDPAEADDDSLMPPPLMPTYEALLSVFLNTGARGRAPGALYDEAPETAMTATREQQQRWNEAAQRVDATLDANKGNRIVEHIQPVEERVQHYHAPRSPNNPDPLHLRYPAHPLDFDKYPKPSGVPPGASGTRATVQAQLQKLGPTPVALFRVNVVAILLRHMMYERNPAMPPWESEAIMHLLERRADVLKLLIGRTEGFAAPADSGRRREKRTIGTTKEMVGERGHGLWEAVWEGAARARRETEVSAAEARRIIAEAEYEAGATQARSPWSTRMESEKEEWAVDRESGVLRPTEEDEWPEDLEMFNRRMAAKTWDKELEMYHSSAG